VRSRGEAIVRASPLLIVLAGIGCGTSTSSPTHEQTIVLNWHEAPGRPGARLIVDVRRLLVHPNGWSVEARVENDAGAPLEIGRPHHPGKTEFGVLVLKTARASEIAHLGPGVLATRFMPELPRVLRPGAAWSGTFSGRGRLAGAHYVRIVFGRFRIFGMPPRGLPSRFRYITDHAYRLP